MLIHPAAQGQINACTRLSGAMLRYIGRKLLHIPIERYVDDFFFVDREACTPGALDAFARLVQGQLLCFACNLCNLVSAHRLVRACLGDDAIAVDKLEHGNPLVILGIRVTLDATGMEMAPDEAKRGKWLARISQAVHLLLRVARGTTSHTHVLHRRWSAASCTAAKPANSAAHSSGRRVTCLSVWGVPC